MQISIRWSCMMLCTFYASFWSQNFYWIVFIIPLLFCNCRKCAIYPGSSLCLERWFRNVGRRPGFPISTVRSAHRWLYVNAVVWPWSSPTSPILVPVYLLQRYCLCSLTVTWRINLYQMGGGFTDFDLHPQSVTFLNLQNYSERALWLCVATDFKCGRVTNDGY